VRPRVILHGAQQPVTIVRIIEAQRLRIGSIEALFLGFGDTRYAGALPGEDVFEPADGLHTAPVGRRQNGFEHVEIAELRRAEVLNRRIFVILRMSYGIAASMEGVGIVLRLAVVRHRLTGNLPAGDSTPVSKGRNEESIDTGGLLKDIQHFLDTFIHK
jgi:hypothetical protein